MLFFYPSLSKKTPTPLSIGPIPRGENCCICYTPTVTPPLTWGFAIAVVRGVQQYLDLPDLTRAGRLGRNSRSSFARSRPSLNLRMSPLNCHGTMLERVAPLLGVQQKPFGAPVVQDA
jgi:hypothetical protein